MKFFCSVLKLWEETDDLTDLCSSNEQPSIEQERCVLQFANYSVTRHWSFSFWRFHTHTPYRTLSLQLAESEDSGLWNWKLRIQKWYCKLTPYDWLKQTYCIFSLLFSVVGCLLSQIVACCQAMNSTNCMRIRYSSNNVLSTKFYSK